MNYRTLCLPVLMCVSVLFAACGGGSNSSTSGDSGSESAADGNSEGAAAIAGLWDVTEAGDIHYQEFTADGLATNWDYDGDEWGDGQNCYIRFGPIEFPHLGGDRFDGFGEVVTVTVNGDEITISDDEGTFTYPRVDGLSSADFTLCE